MQKIDCVHSRNVKTFEKSAKNSKKLSLKSINVKIWVKIRIFQRSNKGFHASGMRTIDFSHKITPKYVIFKQC